MAATELTRQGWHLSEDGIAKCSDDGKLQRCDIIIKKALDIDLKEIGSKWLPEDISKGRVDCLEGPAVLQLSKLRVVSAPKDNEESQTAPRLCRVSLTDGRTICSGVTLEVIKGIGPNTPPGSKILLSGPVEVESNFLLLTNKNVRLLGGNVEGLASAWELKKSLAQQSLLRNKTQDGGPPPFVPFGSKINRNDPIPAKKDFKSLASEKDKEPSAEDDKFLQQRQETIKQALQAKTSSQGGKASFGGGGQKQTMVKDKDLARILEMGFSAQDASSALRQSGGNVQAAINALVSGPQHSVGERFPNRGKPSPRERDGRGDRRRGNREQQRDDDYEDDYVHRPSGPATLFDFIEAKLKDSAKDSGKGDKSSSSASKPSTPSSTSSTTATSTTSNSNHTNSKYSSAGSKEPVFKHSANNAATKNPSGRPNTSQGFSSSFDSSSKYPNRPSSNYNQRNSGGGGGGYSNNASEFGGGRSSNKSYHTESNFGGDDVIVDRRQHTTLPPRFARQRTENSNRDAEEQDSGGNGRQKGQQSDSRKPLTDNNNANYNQQGRYNKNYSSPPSHSSPSSSDYQGRNRGQQSHHNAPPYNKNADSYSNSQHNDNNYPPKDHRYNNRKENATNNQDPQPHHQHHQQHQQRDHRYSNPPNHQQQHYSNNRNQGRDYDYDYEATGDGRYPPHHHPADRGSYNSRNGMNPNNQNYRHPQQSYQEQSYHEGPRPRQSGRGQYNPKQRMDKRYPDDDGPFQVGEMVMAKYWEDNKFYRSVVCAIGPPGTTVLVRFLDYGNEEDVLLTDVRPMQGQGHMGGGGGGGGQWGPGDRYQQHQSRGVEFDPMAFADSGHFVPPMQFNRGGQGSYGGKGGPRKPSQSFYTPPSMKH